MSSEKSFTKYLTEQYAYLDYDTDKDKQAIKFTAQDSEFRVYLPENIKRVNTTGEYTFDVQIDHIRGGAEQDDHVYLHLTLDSNGSIIKYEHEVDMGGNTWSKVIEIAGKITEKVIDDAAGYIAEAIVGVLTIEFTPVGEAAAIATTEIIVQAVAKITGVAFSAFASLTDKLETQDDGGREYFPMVVTHTTLRLQTAAMEYAYNHQNEAILGFDYQNFANELGADKTTSNTNVKAKDKKALEYDFNGKNTRTWYHDYTTTYGNAGIVVSCKVDEIRDNNPDDHLLIIAGFDSNKNLITARVTMTMENEDTQTLSTLAIGADGNVYEISDKDTKTKRSEKSVFDAIENQLKDALKKMKHYDDFSSKRKDSPLLVRKNIEWMQAGITKK